MNKGSRIRDEIVFKTLEEELLGPCAYGSELDVQPITTILKDRFNLSFVTSLHSQEILKVYPTQRYGVGVVYPVDSQLDEQEQPSQTLQKLDDEQDKVEVTIDTPTFINNIVDGDQDFDISLTNTRAPSAIGLSFLLDPTKTEHLLFKIHGAFYQDFTASMDTGEKSYKETWWYRKPVEIELKISISELSSSFKIPLTANGKVLLDDNLKNFFVEGVVRKHDNNLLFTVSLVNRGICTTFIQRNRFALFQSKLAVNIPSSNCAILPYPEPLTGNSDDTSNRLLYRNAPVFSRGHGIASDWNVPPYSTALSVSEVFTSALPSFETPSVSTDIELDNGRLLTIEMEELSKIQDGSVGDIQLRNMLSSYSTWIVKQEALIEYIYDDVLEIKAREHIEGCKVVLRRMEEGYDLVKADFNVRNAFQLANLSMYEQQKHSPKKVRKISFDEYGHLRIITPYKHNDALGAWRQFQIGFLLMCLKGACVKDSPERENVELIWFPTGGGKTEAYLGLAAFTLLYQRIVYGEAADGVQAIMRYTLRLLTAQQLQRAATLICCLDVIRVQHRIPGKQFSIGLWVGGSNTPNKRKSALRQLTELKANVKYNRRFDNPFLLDRCPYCSAQLGIAKDNNKQEVVGYKTSQQLKTVIFSCTDSSCHFAKYIPVIVIDDDIYDICPSLVIGTVDKFAMLAWQPKIRSLFGIGNCGTRVSEPPQLIIQDELHLISGPLGSMVALYEPLIQKLCSYELNNKIIKPKIVCATATTKGYKEQILGIYGRKDVTLFPAPGLEASDSFFSKYLRDEESKLLPGRRYVGVCAPGLGSVLTTQVRTQAALLLAPNRIEVESRDPWVTLLSFYNSIRELGGALTLFQSDIVSYLLEQKRRYPKDILPRKFLNGRELTSRLKDDEIPQAIVDLERTIDTDILTEKFYKEMKSELTNLKKNHAELDCFSSACIDEMDKIGRLRLVNYHDLETISNFLRNLKVSKKLPKNCKAYYELCSNYYVKSFCLASSIIEVGVDIDRLALMSIVGQPKTTAQYIQVSGRVGRKPKEKPGLVVTIYNNSKPRDKSHYEDFRSYHQRLYAKVEPASVTPFSRPAIKRGLAAITVAAIRQFSPLETAPQDVDINLLQHWIKEFISLRKNSMSPDELEDVQNFFERFLKAWPRRTRDLNEWGSLTFSGEVKQNDLLFPLGATGNLKGKLPCPTSMRNVDGESSMWISNVYSEFDDDGEWDV
jgi:hypothetical protein